MLDQNNTYEFAGKGARRRRLRLETEARIKPTPDARETEIATSKRAPEFRDISGSEMRKKIRLLTLRTVTFENVSDILKREGYRVSGIAVSGVRSDMRAAIKLLLDEGLLDAQRLKQYRRKHSR
ncbi:hypothetical protein [Bradyrhizobium diazoefficiens]|uniref:hypothetical protein n=1 Tax=Bradyrhizobium diazoefficiens TaxID=1355477 RepID=UPI003491371B